jgi:hypothetical protein
MNDLQTVISLLEREWEGLEWEPVDLEDKKTKLRYQGIEEGLLRARRIVREFMAEQQASKEEEPS